MLGVGLLRFGINMAIIDMISRWQLAARPMCCFIQSREPWRSF